MGIPANRSLESGKQGLTISGIDSGIDFIVKTHKKIFPSDCFRAQRLYYIIITVLSYEHGATKVHSANISHTAMRAVYPHVHTLIKSMLTTSYTTAFVERAVYQDGGVINILAKSLQRRTMELQLL